MKSKMFLVLLVLFVSFSFNVKAADYTDVQISNIYVDSNEVDKVPAKSEGYYFEKTECNNGVVGEWNRQDWSIKLNNIKPNTVCKVYFTSDASKSGENPENNQKNPNTGIFLNITLVVGAIALSIYAIRRVRNNRKFFRV